MRNLEMTLRRDQAEWRVYPLSRPGCWLARWDKWRPAGGGLLATYALELGWDEAVLMAGKVIAMDDAAFQSWHAQTLAALAETADAAPAAHAGASRPGRRHADR